VEHPLAPGQVQPLEAFFRQLLGAALGHETFASVIAGEAVMLDRVKAQVSDPLGRGTGRVVETLVIYPAVPDQPLQTEVSAQFRHKYTISGMRGNQLEIEHGIRFALIDRNRWLRQNSPDPESFLRQQSVEATKIFLHDKRFEDIVSLYLGQEGENKLENAVLSHVTPIAATIGYRLVSVVTILAIPEQHFIEGRDIVLPEDAYQLADPLLQPRIRVKVTVKVINGGVFARALAREDDFQEQIRTAIVHTLRTTLRSQRALEYYGSAYVNGIALPSTGDATTWRSANPETDGFTAALRESLGIMLRDRFGLIATHFDLEPGEDPIIERMKGLANLPVRYEETFSFGHEPSAAIQINASDFPTITRMNATATIFIISLAADHWPSFYNSVPRYKTIADHVNEICSLLTQTLRLAEHHLLQNGRPNLQARAVPASVVEHFVSRLREEYGLVARLRPLVISVYRARSDQAASMVSKDLIEELRLLLQKRREISGFASIDPASIDGDDKLEQLTRRIALVRQELDIEAQQRATEVDDTQILQVEQDLLTGKIEPSLGSDINRQSPTA
jgi:hypothetical protein